MKRAVTFGLLSILFAAVPAVAGAQGNDWGLWNGAHLGLNVGGGLGTDPGTSQCSNAGTPNGPGCPVPGYAGGASTGGILGGVQLGWDTSADRLVFGVEGDIDYSDIQGTPSYSGSLRLPSGVSMPGYTISDKQTQNYLATLRVRLGYELSPHSMFYLTGGYADAQEALSVKLTDTTAPGKCYCGTTTVGAPGWVEGAGVEWGMGHRMTARVEFLNYNLRMNEFEARLTPPPPGPFTYGKDFYFQGDVVRVGVNWRL